MSRILTLGIAIVAMLPGPLPLPASLDSEMTPVPFIVVAQDRRHYFKMIPEPIMGPGPYTATGRAVYLADDGSDELLWSFDGMFTWEVYISRDAEHLVWVDSWVNRRKPFYDDVVLAFYKHGTLLAEYKATDLVKDHSKFIHTASHYYWRPDGFWAYEKGGADWQRTEPSMGETFHFFTVDGIEYDFDWSTGKLVSARPVREKEGESAARPDAESGTGAGAGR